MKKRFSILSIVGARPQFIKLAAIAGELSGRFDHRIVHTGQHYDANMSDLFFKQLRIPAADVNLGVRGGRHGAMTGKMLSKIEQVLVADRPDMLLVFGDTNSTLAGALAAAKLGLPVGHVEAGLRSFVSDMPEEINRRVTDQLAKLLFCPTIESKKNLKKEGLSRGIIHSGDLMYELLHNQRANIKKNGQFLHKLGLKRNQFLLLTFHRAANTDDKESLDALLDILEDIPWPVLFPVHPRTRQRLKQFRMEKKLTALSHVIEIEPTGYLDTLTAAMEARAVMTDSGGLQKEALFLGTPVLTLRKETEWVETLSMGNRLVGLDKNRILKTLASKQPVKKIPYLINRRKPSLIIADGIAAWLSGGC